MKKHCLKVFLSLLAFCAVCFAFALSAQAGVVAPSGEADSYTDKYNIQYELDTTGSVTLMNGGTYYLLGPIYIGSNMQIEATGATLICYRTAFYNIPQCANYQAIQNLYVNGGTWRFAEAEGYRGSTMKIIHGSNIRLTNMKLRHHHADGHGIELIACKDAVIKNCDIAPLGESDSKTEEAVQLDVATHTTAYFLEQEPFYTDLAPQLQNGATCKNITIDGCKIKGNRGVVANYTKKEGGKYLAKLHENIVLKNNTITSANGEAVALFNTKSATVKNNKITCNAKGKDSYTVGLHIASFGKTGALKNGKITVSGNTVKGGRQAIFVYSHTASKFGTVTIKNNKLYCRMGKKNALDARQKCIKKSVQQKNKTYQWKTK